MSWKWRVIGVVWLVAATLPAQEVSSVKITKPSDLQIAVTRSFPVARQKVFDALTRADQVPRWYEPKRMSLVSYESDLKAGGNFRYVFQRSGGKRMEMRGVYREVESPHRWVHTEGYDFSPLTVVVTNVLEEAGGKTVLTQPIEYPSKEERDGDFEGVASSAEEMFAKLERYLTTGQ